MTSSDQPDSPPDEARLIFPGSTVSGITEEGLLTASEDTIWTDLLGGAEAGRIDGNPRELLVYIDRGMGGGGPVEIIPAAQWLWHNQRGPRFFDDAWGRHHRLGGGCEARDSVAPEGTATGNTEVVRKTWDHLHRPWPPS